MWKTPYRVAILTASDRCAAGARRDVSGPLLRRRMEAEGCAVVQTALLADDAAPLAALLKRWCDENAADLILTTGGTGLSPRDAMPEATLCAAQRQVPGIAEAMRACGLALTPHAMLSRGVAATRGRSLIINLPGSPKAAGECLDAILPALEHALDTLCKDEDPHGKQC